MNTVPKQNPGGNPGRVGEGEEAANAESDHEHSWSQHLAGPAQCEGVQGQRRTAAHRCSAESCPAACTRTLFRLLHHSGLLVWKPHPPRSSTPGARVLTFYTTIRLPAATSVRDTALKQPGCTSEPRLSTGQLFVKS